MLPSLDSRAFPITVVIPTIPPRKKLLQRALASVEAQTLPVAHTVISTDTNRQGAPATRQAGLEQVTTEWVAFLDDDDEFKPKHLEILARAQLETNADYLYSWYDVVGGSDPLPHFGKPFDPENPVNTTITTLVRTSIAQAVGFYSDPGVDLHSPKTRVAHEDYNFTVGCVNAGAKFHHVPKRTWLWHHDSGNTSGLPTRW